MAWFFKSAETVLPELVSEEDDQQTTNEITETAYTGCAWCGDGEGCCDYHMSVMFAQSDERKSRQGR